MERRLFGIYKYSVGNDRATKEGYSQWLENVGDWFEAYTTAATKGEEATKTEQK